MCLSAEIIEREKLLVTRKREKIRRTKINHIYLSAEELREKLSVEEKLKRRVILPLKYTNYIPAYNDKRLKANHSNIDKQ
jgi:hypothetical protein